MYALGMLAARARCFGWLQRALPRPSSTFPHSRWPPSLRHFSFSNRTAAPGGAEGALLRQEDAFASGGYGVSKWVAEQFVLRALADGLPGAIFKPGMIFGHTASGAANPGDFQGRFLRQVVALGAAFACANVMEM